jgi:CRP-like cAMP-binding protein
VVLNHLTTESDVRDVLEFFARGEVPAPRDSDEDLADLLAGGDEQSGLLEALTPEGRSLLVTRSFRRRFAAGDGIVARWGSDRDLYLVLAGETAAYVDGREVSRMRAGDFFGEIAAADWGSGYGSLRTADVVATSDVEILMVPVEVVGELMASEPDFRQRLSTARTARLARR